jgi:hypothetical protein
VINCGAKISDFSILTNICMKIVLLKTSIDDISFILCRLYRFFRLLKTHHHLNHANIKKYYVILIPLNRPTFAFTFKIKNYEKIDFNSICNLHNIYERSGLWTAG